MTAPIVAWIVRPAPDLDYDQGAELVLAATRERARALAAPGLGESYVDVRGCRSPEHDKLVDGRGERIVGVRELRKLGWGQADEEPCASCGLWSFDLDEFEICKACGNCKECGHDDEDDDGPCPRDAGATW